MKRGHQEVARTTGSVASEHAACTVGAVRRGRKAKQQKPRRGITKSRNGATPVDIVPVRTLLLGSDARAVRAQTGTLLA